MQKKKIQSTEELYGRLGEAFNFTKGDLEANRAGFMSHRQKLIILEQNKTSIAVGIILAIVFLIALAFYFWISLSESRAISVAIYGVIAMICITGSGLIALIVSVVRLNLMDARHLRVDYRDCYVADGLTVLELSSNSDSKVFQIPVELKERLYQENYRVYFARQSGGILSVEVSASE